MKSTTTQGTPASPNRIGEWRKRRGIKLAALEEGTGLSQSYLSRLISGRRPLRLDHLQTISSVLDVPVSELLPTDLRGMTDEELISLLGTDEATSEDIKSSSTSMAAPMVAGIAAQLASASNAEIGDIVKYLKDLVPIYGSAAGGPNGQFALNGERLLSTLRPPSLANLRDAYGVIVRGDSMSPRYEDGEIAYAAPLRPYRIGDYVVVQMANDDDDNPSGFIKKLSVYNRKEIILEQLNPPLEEQRYMIFPANLVRTVHKVIGTASDH